MTNSEKYLKDGVDEVAFAGELADLFLSKMEEKYPYAVDTFIDYFHDLAEPTLTEDERVILRNIKIHDCSKVYSLKITRACDNDLWLKVEGKSNKIKRLGVFIDIKKSVFIGQYSHLFQFIKERRRISY